MSDISTQKEKQREEAARVNRNQPKKLFTLQKKFRLKGAVKNG